MTRLYGRALRGWRALDHTPQNWGENISVIGSLCRKGPLATMHVPGSTDGEVFLRYVQAVLVPELWKGAMVVLDNLSAHKVAGVREAIEAAGAELLYLPAYSPDFNPMEFAHSKLKAHLRSTKARSYGALGKAIHDGLETITPKDAQNWFRHCGYKSLPKGSPL